MRVVLADKRPFVLLSRPRVLLNSRGQQGPPGLPGAPGANGNPTAVELRGTGSPEGVVAAAVGTYWTDTAATLGAVRWVKVTGVGTTGWQVVYGDTGPRLIDAAMMQNGWLGGGAFNAASLRVRRAGRIVTLSGTLDPTAATGPVVATLPAGFRPEQYIYGTIANRSGGALTSVVEMSLGGGIQAISVTAPKAGATHVLYLMTWIAHSNTPWPTVLPGSAG